MRAYKQARRKEDDIAIVTACFRVRLDAAGVVQDGSELAPLLYSHVALAHISRLPASIAFGGMAAKTVSAPRAEQALVGRAIAKTGGTAARVVVCLCASLFLTTRFFGCFAETLDAVLEQLVSGDGPCGAFRTMGRAQVVDELDRPCRHRTHRVMWLCCDGFCPTGAPRHICPL